MRAAPLFLGLLACGGDVRVDPASGKQSGYYRVTVATPGIAAADVGEVRLGGVRGYDLAPVGAESVAVTVQGAPKDGPATLEVTADRRHSYYGKYRYEPPLDPRFARLVAIGASLSQGVQNGVPSFHGALMSPPAQLARQLGGYFPLPLLRPGLLPDIAPRDFGPPPECRAPDIVAFVAMHAADAFFEVLRDGYDTGRVNPEVEVHNLAIGGSHVHDVAYGPGDALGGSLISHLVYQPYDRGPARAQLSLAKSLAPTLVMICDLYYNDVADAILGGEAIDPSLITPEASLRADLAVVLDGLDSTGAESFVSNMPSPSLLPATLQKRAAMIAKAVADAKAGGKDEAAAAAASAAAADAAVAEVDARAALFNGILADAASKRHRIHVVDVAGAVGALAKDGLVVGGAKLGVKKFGGLLGLDGVHFTNTGYGMLANVFIEAINAALGTAVPPIDLAPILAADPSSPAALRAAGLDPDLCTK